MSTQEQSGINEKGVEEVKPVEGGGEQSVESAITDAEGSITDEAQKASGKTVEYPDANDGDIEKFGEVVGDANDEIEELKLETEKQLAGLDKEDVDQFLKWKSDQKREINIKASESGNKSVSNAIGGKRLLFDRGGALSQLDDYQEEQFIEHASTEKEIEEALDMVEKLYRDRVDLKAGLLINKGDFNKAKELIVNVTDENFYYKMIGILKKLIEIKPELKKEIMNEVKDLNPEYFEFIEEELAYSEQNKTEQPK